MIAQEHARWQPLGTGRIAPQGSIADRALAERLAGYKRQVAGRYRSVSPADLTSTLPQGPCLVSPKLDGETWFLRVAGGEAWLLSPSGKVIADVPATAEASRLLAGHDLLLAGELYANGSGRRPRVHDLAAALGGGAGAPVEHLGFGAFDLLDDGVDDAQRSPFVQRAERLASLLDGGQLCRCVPFEQAADTQGLLRAYDSLVTRDGHEGMVVRCGDGQVIKVKPEITIDAAVVGFTERPRGGVAELLLALLRPDGVFQLLGRVDTGFTEADRLELAERLRPVVVESSCLAASRSGALFRFVRPEMVVEAKCNDLLTVRANGDPVRRMAMRYMPSGTPPWQALRPLPAASMMHAVFRRVRDDKAVDTDGVRWSQVTDRVVVEGVGAAHAVELPRSQVLRREVFTKRERGALSVRKAVVWKTNKEAADPLYPPFVAFFTDYAPGRQQPLRTDLRVASTVERIHALADAWIKEHVGQGWVPRTTMFDASPLPASCHGADGFRLDLTASFARTSSVNFHVALRRMKALAEAGSLTVESDEKGRPRHYSLAIRQEALVENVRRIESLHRVISRWSGAEVVVNGEPLAFHDVQGVLNAIADVASCWRQQQKQATEGANPCRACFALGCQQLRFSASQGFPGIPRDHPAWYAVGSFDGKVVTLDKPALLAQLDTRLNESLVICPLFGREHTTQRIRELPDTLDPAADPARWVLGYAIDTRKPAWVFPKAARRLPYDVTFQPEAGSLFRRPTAAGPAVAQNGLGASVSSALAPVPHRSIPAARYADVCGQDAAVEAVRDYAELPLKHPELFQRVGVRPGRGILLWGPPGNGKTLLARAVAGESGAHIEVISGPEVLSKWVGEGEGRLRDVFQRAARLAPSVVLMDELDSIAGSRDYGDSRHLRELVSQLLVLLDGLEDRGRVLVIGTTNRPGDIDPAILRPGRIDRKVYLGPPNATGRAALFARLLARMPVGEDVRPEALAARTAGFTGAQVEHVVNEAGLGAVKEAIAGQLPAEGVRVSLRHFQPVIMGGGHSVRQRGERNGCCVAGGD
ncbi:MAG TPA: AAA family ATPase [Planctomycetota bacterium]|nr:AAA family ATPase [Planctomycetota bacterium]